MAVKSLKNLDSYTRGYIEGKTTNQSFRTLLSGDVKTQVNADTVITFTTKLIENPGVYNEITPQIGQVVSGIGIIGIPKVVGVEINSSGETQITVDIPQTLPANTFLTIGDTNSALDQFQITGSTLSRSKEDLRIETLVPQELLGYAGEDENLSGGIKIFLDSYYEFMNTEEFLYRTTDTFEDIVINNIATIRIPDPELKNNKFFSLTAARSSQIFDSEGNLLTVGNNSTDFDIDLNNINIFNVDNLPDIGSLENNSGRTLSIVGLPARLNNKKIIVKTAIQNIVISNPSFRLNTLEDALNINETDESLLDMMQKEIAPAVDKNIKVNKRALYQRLIDFYKIRGSRESIDLFFKLFFQDEEIDVIYPWDSTLKPSSGNWDNQSTLASEYTKLGSNIVASDAASNDLFGTSISLDTNTNLLAVGAPGETSAEGAVYVYTTSDNGSTYGSQVKIVSATGATGDDFGSVVSLSGDVLAISAPDDTEHTGGTTADSGTVEIWQRFLTQAPSTFTWQFQTKLKGSAGGLNFGKGISLDGNTLAVTVPGNVNSDRSNGAVKLYKGTGSNWTLSQTIITPAELNETGVNGWGDKVILRGDYLFVSWTTSVSSKGSISIFHKNPSTGLFDSTPEAILQPNDLSANDLFGSAFDVDPTSNTIIPVCAISSISSTNRAIYVFERTIDNNQVSWNLTDKLLPADGQSDDSFGSSLKIYNNNILVGAPLSDGLGTTAVTNAGLIYHYEKIDQWVQKATYSETLTANNKFGSEIEISRGAVFNLLIGTIGSSTNAGHIVNFTRGVTTGKYLNKEGFLSDKQKLQDSDFYQKFSYVIKAGRNISQWKDTYNKLIHPAGFKYFGEILIVIKAVRDVLGDGATAQDPAATTVTEKVLDDFGNEVTTERVINAFTNAATIRKTLSSMPGIQPGFISDEDLGLLIEALASTFAPIAQARTNKNAKLSIVKLATGGAIPHDGISINEAGAGYNTAPTVSLAEGSNGVVETEVNQFGEIINVVVKGGHPTTASTPASPTSFKFDGSTDSSRDASSTKTGISTTTAGSGSNGVVSIVIGSDKTITSVTATTAGTGYKVGDVITVAGSALGGGADLLLTVNEVHSGSGYTANSAVTTQALSAVTNSGTATAIGKVTNLTQITLASDPLTAGLFYKIIDLGNATVANFNTISTDGYDRTSWKVGDIFQATSTGSGLSTTAKLQLAELGLQFTPFGNKKYRIPPIVEIGPPDAIDSLGVALGSNVNAEARLSIDTEILLDGTAKLALNNRYIIAFKGNITDTQINSIARDSQTTWSVGDVFTAIKDGDDLSATTATVVPFDSGGKITGFQITNAGLGYINDPVVNLRSNSIHEKRVPNVIPIRIVTNGNDVQNIDPTTGRVTSTSIDRGNNYFARKDYNTKAILGIKKYAGEYNISQFESLSIENVSESTINKFNVNTTIQPVKDRNS